MKDDSVVTEFNSRVHKVVIAFVLITAIAAGAFVFAGCSDNNKSEDVKMYKIDYNGQKASFSNARDKYKAGEKVSLVFGMVATDTDYHFYKDGESISPVYDDKKGFVIEFTMPEHDVSIKWESKNSMIDDTEYGGEEAMLVDYYTATVATVGGDSYHELVLYEYSGDKLRLSVFDKDGDSDETREDYLVPVKALEECRAVIKKNEFDNWNDKYEDIGLDGGVTVVKYLNDNGEVVRVSTDCMPDDGKQKLSEIWAVLSSYVKDEYKIK